MTARAETCATTSGARPTYSTGDASDVVIRLARPGERDAVLRFIADMGFNARDAATWDGLNMVAMTAWKGTRLIGAVPLEPRTLQLAPGRLVRSVHQTAVAVVPEFRGRGIGSRMQQAIFAHQPPLAPISTVFREDADSPAYRWYRRNGFAPVMTISAWLLETPTVAAPSAPVEVRDPADPGVDWAGVEELWQTACARRHGGFVCRTQRSLRKWLQIHPYRERYAFKLLLVREPSEALVAYAVLGIGQLHSQTTRVEIMEHAAWHGEARWLDKLCELTVAFAQQRGYRPVRWAMAAADPAAGAARRHGFEPHWRFDLLLRHLRADALSLPELAERRRLWRYHSLDYA